MAEDGEKSSLPSIGSLHVEVNLAGGGSDSPSSPLPSIPFHLSKQSRFMLAASSSASRSKTAIPLLQRAVTACTASRTGLFAAQVQSRAFTSKRPGPSLLYSRQTSRDSSSSLLRSISGSHRSLFTTSRATMADASTRQASASSSSLAAGSCVPCRKGAPRLEEHEIKEQLAQLNSGIEGEGWKIEEVSPGETA